MKLPRVMREERARREQRSRISYEQAIAQGTSGNYGARGDRIDALRSTRPFASLQPVTIETMVEQSRSSHWDHGK